MSDSRVFTTPPPATSSTVPSGRLSRLMRMGQMATGVAGNMLLAGARELAQGRRPNISDLLLTPANALKITQQLAQMRGAAMKHHVIRKSKKLLKINDLTFLQHR